MVASSEHGEVNRQHNRRQNRLDARPCEIPANANGPRVVLHQPASWAEVEEYFRWRAAKENAGENTSEA